MLIFTSEYRYLTITGLELVQFNNRIPRLSYRWKKNNFRFPLMWSDQIAERAHCVVSTVPPGDPYGYAVWYSYYVPSVTYALYCDPVGTEGLYLDNRPLFGASLFDSCIYQSLEISKEPPYGLA